MKLPSEEEVRQKFDIQQKEHFDVLESKESPSPTDNLKEGTKLEKKGYWNGVEVWLRTTIIGGIVLAVILFGDFINGCELIYKYGNLIYTNHDAITEYVSNFAHYAKDKTIGFLVDTTPKPTEEDKKYLQWGSFPTGSALYPASTDWRPS